MRTPSRKEQAITIRTLTREKATHGELDLYLAKIPMKIVKSKKNIGKIQDSSDEISTRRKRWGDGCTDCGSHTSTQSVGNDGSGRSDD